MISVVSGGFKSLYTKYLKYQSFIWLLLDMTCTTQHYCEGGSGRAGHGGIVNDFYWRKMCNSKASRGQRGLHTVYVHACGSCFTEGHPSKCGGDVAGMRITCYCAETPVNWRAFCLYTGVPQMWKNSEEMETYWKPLAVISQGWQLWHTRKSEIVSQTVWL